MKKWAYWLFIVFAVVIMDGCKKSTGSSSPNPPNPPGPPPPPPPPPTVKKPHFFVDGNTLRDSTGTAFVMRGNNFPVFWFPNDYKPSLSAAASLGCNAARLVWMVQSEPWTPSLSVLEDAIATCIQLKMVPIVELHDFTGGTQASDITKAVQWYVRTDVKTMMDKYSAFVILNIANEWGGPGVTSLAWRNAYVDAVLSLRSAGYKIPIMIDAPGWGQDETAIVEYGANILNHDPEKNLIFSTHAYSNWNNSASYTTRVDNILSKNLCLVFGEFGWNVPDNQQPADFVCKVDAQTLMLLCQQKKVGYLGWSWYGNNAANDCFDMCKSWNDTSQLTVWGRQWAYDPNGVKLTSVKSPAFR